MFGRHTVIVMFVEAAPITGVFFIPSPLGFNIVYNTEGDWVRV